MEVHHVRAFLAVAQELHFGRAAMKLHIAQPPLSRTIRQLERDLGSRLFDRTTRSVRLTSAGEALVGPAQEILDEFRAARVAVQAAGKGETGRVRLGFAGPSSHMPVGKLARQVRHEYPGIDLIFRSVTYANEGLAHVIDGSLDLAIVRWNVAPPDIASRVVAREHHVIVVPPEHRLADRDIVSMAELRKEAWVGLPGDPGSHVHETFIRRCHEAGYAPDIVQTAPESWTLMALVSAGVGIAFSLDTVTANVSNADLAVLSIKEGQEPVWARLAWRADDRSPALRRVIEVSRVALPTPAESRMEGAEDC